MSDAAKPVKMPKYVKVYDALFARLRSGELPQGSCLPTEPELARQMGVSRATLRQALALLQDDHLIKNVRGKGNYVLGGHTYRRVGLESLAHPLYLCCKEPISETELDVRIDVPSKYYIQNLNCQPSAVVVCNRWYKNQGVVVAYSYTFLPLEVAAQAGLDLAESRRLEDFLDQGLYERAAYSSLAVSHTDTGRFMTLKYRMPAQGAYTMLYEVVYAADESVLAVSKHYMAAENSEVLIYTRPGASKREPAQRERKQ